MRCIRCEATIDSGEVITDSGEVVTAWTACECQDKGKSQRNLLVRYPKIRIADGVEIDNPDFGNRRW